MYSLRGEGDTVLKNKNEVCFVQNVCESQNKNSNEIRHMKLYNSQPA